MILAELTGLEIGSLICVIAFGGGSLLVAIVALNKKQEVKVEQPVSITITEELHKVFANREAFNEHVADNKREVENIFSKIGGVERGLAAKIHNEMSAINEDRRRTLELLNRRNERIMFALGKIAAAQGIDISPTD